MSCYELKHDIIVLNDLPQGCIYTTKGSFQKDCLLFKMFRLLVYIWADQHLVANDLRQL